MVTAEQVQRGGVEAVIGRPVAPDASLAKAGNEGPVGLIRSLLLNSQTQIRCC